MNDTPAGRERKYWAALDPNDPAVQLFVLSERVETLAKEKEEIEQNARLLEQRIATIEKAFTKGSGMLVLLPIIGAVLTFLIMNGGRIFSPWTSK